jgi:hypothetical protein
MSNAAAPIKNIAHVMKLKFLSSFIAKALYHIWKGLREEGGAK